MSLSRIPLQQVFRSKSERGNSVSTSSSSNTSYSTSPVTRDSPAVRMAQALTRGTRTPQMLEYERQAEERSLEAEKMQEERDRMLDAEMKMRKEQERIAQEEYEMRQYYEAEALKHAEEVRLHQEEVRRHQERVREHERRVLDHEASSEAFAKVIAMPAKPGRERQVSFLAAMNGNGKKDYVNGNGAAPPQFPNGV